MSADLASIAERTGRATNIHIYYAAMIGFEHYRRAPPPAPPTTPDPPSPPPSLHGTTSSLTPFSTSAAPSAAPSGSCVRARAAHAAAASI